jgi:hypothetical protein
MEIMLLKCPKGCRDTFQTKTELLNHHLLTHEQPLPERYHLDLPPLGEGELVQRRNGEQVR